MGDRKKYNIPDVNRLMTQQNKVKLSHIGIYISGREFYRGHSLRCPGFGLGAPKINSHSHSDILMEVPFTQEKWPCPDKNDIPSLTYLDS